MAARLTGGISRLIRLSAGLPAVSQKSSARSLAADPAARQPGSERADGRPRGRTASFRSHVTARGALLGLFVLFLLICLVAAWREIDVLAGLGYCAGCVAAPVYARRDAQLAVVLSTPAVFLLAEIITQVLTAQGSSGHSSALSVLEGTALTLADTAPWLFAGTAACVLIALTRGLPHCVRELRESPGGMTGLRAARGRAGPAAAASTPTGPSGHRRAHDHQAPQPFDPFD